ncbi:hypothetical protein GSI_12813 [Ganoderma sinense ZZ0214-1]|uniref:RNA helicase n=1 Tax=Ganoderma sinense ZZ0214-1 TaxID=1077348 RepID=A0A2G8RTT5_9APHY|nr:hypothetical protein GSI_12813 [Ganoderma sinense ZZ0214-1]
MMAEFPLDPQARTSLCFMAKTLIVSPEFDCSHEILTIIAMLNLPTVWVRPNDQQTEADSAKRLLSIAEGDHLSLMNVYNAYQQNKDDPNWAQRNYVSQRALTQAENVRAQLVSLMERLNLPVVSKINSDATVQYDNVLRALVCGYFMQIACRERKIGYLTVKDHQPVSLHPSCTLVHTPEWVLFNEFILTTQPYIRTVTAVSEEWLLELAPEYFDLKSFPQGEAKRSLERVQRKTMGGPSTGPGKRARRRRRPALGEEAPSF